MSKTKKTTKIVTLTGFFFNEDNDDWSKTSTLRPRTTSSRPVFCDDKFLGAHLGRKVVLRRESRDHCWVMTGYAS